MAQQELLCSCNATMKASASSTLQTLGTRESSPAGMEWRHDSLTYGMSSRLTLLGPQGHRWERNPPNQCLRRLCVEGTCRRPPSGHTQLWRPHTQAPRDRPSLHVKAGDYGRRRVHPHRLWRSLRCDDRPGGGGLRPTPHSGMVCVPMTIHRNRIPRRPLSWSTRPLQGIATTTLRWSWLDWNNSSK